MFILDKVLATHAGILKQYGGATGIRDANLVDSALNRPFQTFGGEDLYPSVFEKAAAVNQSVIINHPLLTVIKEQVLFWVYLSCFKTKLN